MTTQRKLTTLAVGVALAALSASAAALAQAQPNKPALLTAIDSDHNGSVTKREYMAYREEVFERFNANGDDIIGESEWLQGSRGIQMSRSGQDLRRTEPMSGASDSTASGSGTTEDQSISDADRQALMAAVDTNDDQSVSKDEWHARSRSLFARRDHDKNSTLSPEELEPL